MSVIRGVGIGLFLLTPVICEAQQNSTGSGANARPVSMAARTDARIDVNGRLDEADWALAVPVTQFTQVDPQEGQPVSQRTAVRILYDADAIYFGIRAWDDGPITTRLGRRDMDLQDSDWFGVVIDSYHDHQTGYSFDVNPGGVKRDAVKSMTPGGGERDDLSWDAVWDVVTSVDSAGWTAEYRIPFSQIRFRSQAVHLWGLQLERVIGRNREYAVSAFTPRIESGGIPAFGHLEGIEDIEPGSRLELLPYMVGKTEHVDPGSNPFRDDSEQRASGGLDLLYRVTSNLTLNATINPDFGQVEVDPAVVNLGVYETFFEEKRPFFIEGSEIFQFTGGTSGGQLFYTRRIGRSPQTGPPTPQADVPTETTILGAAKLSGRTAGWSVGMLTAVTAEENARYMTSEGATETMVAEPLTGYFVGRARRELRAGLTSIGVMGTAVRRDLSTTILQDRLRSGAYSAGFDFSHQFSGRVWALSGNVVGSRVEGSPQAITRVQWASNHFFQRPDADHLEVDEAATSLMGYSASLSLDKISGAHWLGGLAVAVTSPQYEVNDLGFAYRTDRRDLAANLIYREIRPGSFFRNWMLMGQFRNEMNFDTQTILRMAIARFQFRHLNFWGGSLTFIRSFRANDDRSTRGGPMIFRPANFQLMGNFNTDGRKAVILTGAGLVQWDEYHGHVYIGRVGVNLRPSSRWSLSFGPRMMKARVAAQYVTTVADPSFAATYDRGYIFAQLDQTEIALETRFNFTFRPGLTLETYVQPLVSVGNYGQPRYLEAPGTFDFAQYNALGFDPDFNYRSLRGNAVLRWEWLPGSNIYLAWQQRRVHSARAGDFKGVGDFDFNRDVKAVFRAPADNIFLIKVSYWLSP
jgi:hypothetical protein